MSRFTLSMLFVFAAVTLSGQDISVTFTGTGATSLIDSVTAINLKTGQRVTLPGNETLLLTGGTGVSSVSLGSGAVNVFPNPFSGKATVSVTVGNAQEVGIKVQNLIGQVIAQLKSSVLPGDNLFAVSVNSPGIYVVGVTADQGTAGYKVMCTDVNASENNIQFLSNNASSPELKSSQTTYTLGYTEGDIILYRCYADTFISLLTDSPVDSKNYLVEFVSCSDRESRNYAALKIGEQTWMASNLAYLPAVSPSMAGSATEAYHYVYGYEGSNVSAAKASANFDTYGVLYNRTAARTACPSGWHLPSDTEWTTLTDYLGNQAGGKLKEAGNDHWSGRNATTTNSSGFTALPGGYRKSNGGIIDLGSRGHFWSSTGSGTLNTWSRGLEFNSGEVNRTSDLNSAGYSVRCLLGATLPEVVTDSVSVSSETTATGGGDVTYDGGAAVIARGVCWNTTGTPTVRDPKTTDGSGSGAFTSTLTGLVAGTPYYVRAYATNSAGTAYGAEKLVTTGQTLSILEVTKVLTSAENKFIALTALAPDDPKTAIEKTKDWLLGQPAVEAAETVDSIYINISLKSGLQTTFSFREVDQDGYSVFRGGGKTASGVRFDVSGTNSKNLIENKNVLIYAPAYSQFYKPGEMEKLLTILNGSGIVTTTLMTDKQCNFETIATFNNYGLVIIDTHGEQDGFLLGTEIDTATSDTEEMLKEKIIAAAGPNAYAKIQTNELRVSKTSRYKDFVVDGEPKYKSESYYELWATSKYIDGLPDMPGTVIFGNMCYSGCAVVLRNGNEPIRTAILNKNPISYYCYAKDNNYSAPVENIFAKSMEDSLVRSLVVDGDSTGIAHLDFEGNNFYDKHYLQISGGRGYLFFRQFGAQDYSYEKCASVFTDNRDGIIYKAACIGKQSWMAENLRYNAPGSAFYNDDPANDAVYGKLYDWNTVMNGALTSGADPSGVKGICPTGWHLPSQAEWQALIDFTGGTGVAGKALKSVNLWYQGGNGSNASGFTALPSGIYNGIHWVSQTTATYFWSTTELSSDAGNVQIVYMDYTGDQATIKPVYKFAPGGSSLLAPVRCLKD